MPPIDFCNRNEPPTHLWIFQTSICAVGKIPHQSSDSNSLAGDEPTGVSQPRGCALPIRNARRMRPLARRIYPDLIGPDTSCRR